MARILYNKPHDNAIAPAWWHLLALSKIWAVSKARPVSKFRACPYPCPYAAGHRPWSRSYPHTEQPKTERHKVITTMRHTLRITKRQ